MSKICIQEACAEIWTDEVLLTHLPLDKMAHTFADNIFKHIFFNENVRLPLQISLKFVPRGSNDNKSALVLVWLGAGPVTKRYLNQCWPDSPTHICGTRGRWVNTVRPEQNDRQFADDIFKFSCIKIVSILKFHWSLLLRAQLTLSQHWFRSWLGAY